MSTRGIEGLLVETHNWGRAVKFWQGLGYELQFETDHHSGQLRHPSGGPYVFVAERAEDAELLVRPILGVDEPADFVAPSGGTVERPFEDQHWGVFEMLLADPDGRILSLQTTLPGSGPPAS